MDDFTLTARIIAKTAEYLDFPSVVGHETPFLDYLERDFSGAGFAVTRRRNLTIVETGSPGPIHCAHVDRHGVIMDGAGHGNFAAFAVKTEKYGQMAAPTRSLFDKIASRYRGEEMFAYDRETGGRLAYGDVEDVVFDTDNERVRFHFRGFPPLPAGTPVAFSRTVQREGDNLVSGQLDNPLSAALLRVAAEAGLTGKIVFAAEEEIGRSAGHILQWAGERMTSFSAFLIIDTSPFADGGEAGKGTVVLRRKDANGAFDDAMVGRLETGAASLNIPVLFKDAFIEEANGKARAAGEPEQGLGITELGRLVTMSQGQFTGTTLQIPTWNYHSNRETTTHAAVLNAARLLLSVGGA
ncbi:hypothetical protein [Aquisalinus flavus]|uniref:Peptidase M42 n=1 Tax=Aquisalinus flavus TaxID=1526572 RepID=A0A8J2Y2Y9_9PROT|nr:hypothetical protein [Aquisalinus flavus]MBD0426877.1 hypothetical protein [Aquisalinus flavus]UNE46724.1 hypothetical protein FF099_00935 [Aquisalinus flavus]GGC96676.1 peptidase M42 [Aquisalinus flavus]